jgi:hypothetical protein
VTAVVERYHVPPSQCWEGSRGQAHGNVHLHVVDDVTLGRLKRRAGECLCAKRHGSYERPLEDGERAFRCERCAAVAVRNGIAWPSAERLAATA